MSDAATPQAAKKKSAKKGHPFTFNNRENPIAVWEGDGSNETPPAEFLKWKERLKETTKPRCVACGTLVLQSQIVANLIERNAARGRESHWLYDASQNIRIKRPEAATSDSEGDYDENELLKKFEKTKATVIKALGEAITLLAVVEGDIQKAQEGTAIAERAKNYIRAAQSFYICAHNDEPGQGGKITNNLCGAVLHRRCFQKQFSGGSQVGVDFWTREIVASETSYQRWAMFQCNGLPSLRVEIESLEEESMYYGAKYPKERAWLTPHMRFPALAHFEFDARVDQPDEFPLTVLENWMEAYQGTNAEPECLNCVYCGKNVLKPLSHTEIEELKDRWVKVCKSWKRAIEFTPGKKGKRKESLSPAELFEIARLGGAIKDIEGHFDRRKSGADQNTANSLNAQQDEWKSFIQQMISWLEEENELEASADFRFPNFSKVVNSDSCKLEGSGEWKKLHWLRFYFCTADIFFPRYDEVRDTKTPPMSWEKQGPKNSKGMCGGAFHLLCGRVFATADQHNPGHYFCWGPGNTIDVPFNVRECRSRVKKQVENAAAGSFARIVEEYIDTLLPEPAGNLM